MPGCGSVGMWGVVQLFSLIGVWGCGSVGLWGAVQLFSLICVWGVVQLFSSMGVWGCGSVMCVCAFGVSQKVVLGYGM